MEVTIFLSLFCCALDCVDEAYYGNVELGRYGERVFCYELYHQMRTLMSELTPDDETLLRLQAELQKNPVPIDEQVSKRLGIQRLSATYVPDFLLHAPGKFSHQRVVIEVKSNPKTEFGDIRKDLLKIQRLITQYQYQQGVFLIVNTPIEQIRRKMTAPRTLQLVAHDLPDCSRILFISKERRDAKTYALPLDEIEKL